jgi:hypothetical protein
LLTKPQKSHNDQSTNYADARLGAYTVVSTSGIAQGQRWAPGRGQIRTER